MSFNLDLQNLAIELLFSKIRHQVDHPAIFVNNIPVKKVDKHKHLGIILKSKLSFQFILNLPFLKRKGASAC